MHIVVYALHVPCYDRYKMNKRQQKVAIMGVTAAVTFMFIALFLMQRQSQTASKTAPEFESAASQLFAIPEIGKTFTKPTTLGTTSYKMNQPNSIYIYSSTYEALADKCRGRHIAELLLRNIATAEDDMLITGDYQFAHLTLHPMGQCNGGSAQEQALYKAVADMVQKP